MFKFNNRDQNNVNGVFIVNFIVNFTYSGALLLTLNIFHVLHDINFIVNVTCSGALLLTLNKFHILHDVKYAKIRVLYWKKRKKSNKFNKLQMQVFFLTNMPPPLVYKPPPLSVYTPTAY